MWFKLASHLGQPLQRVQKETTSTEFIEWCTFLDMEDWERTKREDFYMAQIAMEIARTRSSRPGQLRIEDFLLKFVTAGDNGKPMTAQQLEERTQLSKARWRGITGIGKQPPVSQKPKR